MSAGEGPDWERVEELFHRVLGLPPERAASVLDVECGAERELRLQVESLLASSGAAEGFFDSLSERVFSGAPGEPAPASEALRSVFDPLRGRTVRRYEILEPLGGGMSRVYRGFDPVLQRGVALKFLPPVEPGSEAHRRFFVEARATAALEHENICNIHEIEETDEGRPFIVMALYEGETLRDRLRGGPLPYEEALDLALQACRGLAVAHASDIIHRDIKPGNLFITREGVVKVLDFGLAKLTDISLTGAGRTIGTLSYMSPEQAVGERVDPRTDVWSMGVVLYEMLTGRLPFRGRNAAEVIRAILHGSVVPPREVAPDLPDAAGEVILAALAKDREARTPSIRALEAGLAAAR